MVDLSRERPCIHVCALPGTLVDLDRWVEVGAEEDGIPTRTITVTESDVVAAAYAAAQSSRVDVGVAISADRVVLHEVHMPELQPVLSVDLGSDPRRACRRMGGNAARLVARLPLRIEDEPEVTLPDIQPKTDSVSVDPAEVARIVATILKERGIR